MTNKDVAKTVVVTVASFSIVAAGAPWLVIVPVAVGAGLYLGKLFDNDENEKKDKKDEDE